MIFKDKKYIGLILGGSSGIGKASAVKLASEGMNLCIVYRERKNDSRETEAFYSKLATEFGVKILTFNNDASDKIVIENVCNRLLELKNDCYSVRMLLHSISKGNLKPLVSVSNQNPDFGSGDSADAFKILHSEKNKIAGKEYFLDSSDFQLTLQNMALSLVDWVKLLHEKSLFADDSRVIALSSEGNNKAMINYAAVSATKAALEAIIRSIAMEYGPYGIRANTIQAGITDTASLRMIPGSDYLKQSALFRNPLGRLTAPEDIANAVYLLCIDESAWINAALIKVDGGESVG